MKSIFSFLFWAACIFYLPAQSVKPGPDWMIREVSIPGGIIPMEAKPAVTFEVNNTYFESGDPKIPIQLRWMSGDSGTGIRFINSGKDTLTLKNVLPLGQNKDLVYITGAGDHYLSRTHLYIPGYSPVNVIVPDNAWNLGYASMPLNGKLSFYAFTRRKSQDKALRRRFETVLYPGGSVYYEYHADTFSGAWQQGLRACFRDRKLYDLSSFDDSLYRRPDLQWIRSAKMMHLIMAWDQRLYDRRQGRYALRDFIQKSKAWYGGDDVIGIWPTWPALGIDQRNQWDLFRDLPGGIKVLRKLSEDCHREGVRFFICYNPWDESTRKEDHLNGMADLVYQTDADGVVLDTRGSSSKELQAAADRVRPGVIMYSEGMAVPADMENIIAGRVHNALYYPPVLNLNKLIQPEFGIFRVAELYMEPVRREIHTSLFNGYGIEFNIFHPGNPEGLEEQYKYIGRSVRILREHTSLFNGQDWTPLYPSFKNGILINRWPGMLKEIYTVYNSLPSGYRGQLFEAPDGPGHWVDLWNHKELDPETVEGKVRISLELEPYPQSWQGTNNEGSMGVLGRFGNLLKVRLHRGDLLDLSAMAGTKILLWAGAPSYSKTPSRLDIRSRTVNLTNSFPGHEGDYVIQLFDSLELIDERIVTIDPATARYLTAVNKSSRHDLSPEMVQIPADTFTFYSTHGDEFIPYPSWSEGSHHTMPSFYMDRHPVTNKEFETFLLKSKYKPKNREGFLKHWDKGKLPKGLENHPVVYVSREDIQAYCAWAGKRLPTEIEWQYAAQTSKRNPWPWGEEAGIQGVKSEIITGTLTHTTFTGFDSTLANPGNGKPDPVGAYPKGKNPFGLTDLVGSVWQMTADHYRSGSYEYLILKGGSYYKPTASWWYVQGGPQSLAWKQMLLLVDEGFERKGTVGFRCVRDKE